MYYIRMNLPRLLDLSPDIKDRSVFLFGPRQTGKTTYLKNLYRTNTWFNLLRGDVFLRLSSRPGRLHEELAAVDPGKGPVIIDEIQKLPSLLDDVHDLIESRDFHFVLTGSSPAKLRRSGINLLGGRARIRYLYPFVSAEIPDWKIERTLLYGNIPSVYLSDNPRDDLLSYCGAYLQLEVQAEGLVRGIEPFSRFLQTAARCAGEQIVFERVAGDAQVPARTVREYYQVLQDTLIGTVLEPVTPAKKPKRKPVSHGKFYFFDNGVAHTLAGINHLDEFTPTYGKALEHFIFTELRAWIGYTKDTRYLGFWRTVDGNEVDFVIGSDIAIEVKSTRSLSGADLKGLRAIAEESPFKHRIIVCNEPVRRIIDGIEIFPIKDFLDALWNGAFSS